MQGTRGKFAVRAGELFSYSAGILLTGFFAIQIAQGEVERRSDIEAFEAASAPPAQALFAPEDLNQVSQFATPTDIDVAAVRAPDTSDWSPQRIADFQASMSAALPDVLAVLDVPSLGLEVPVYSTDSDLTMDRGAGIIDGMAYPHEPGNIGIAGHRDGYFRVLKDVKVGDSLVLKTLHGTKRFTVDATRIVEISDLSLLQDTQDQRVTLVTCYPFYFVGNAPQRFIVTATLDSTYVNRN